MAIVYVLNNPAFDNYVKIGRTTNLEQRLRALDNTSVPLPFRCVYAIEVDDDVNVERLVHQAFADHRTRTTREFFEIDAQRIIAALRLTGGRDVTPKDDIAEDEEGIAALVKAKRTPRRAFSFSDVNVAVGNTLVYANDDTITAEVIGNKKILFEDEEMSLSKSALILLHRDGYTWRTVNGWSYWLIDGETMAERCERVVREKTEADDEDE